MQQTRTKEYYFLLQMCVTYNTTAIFKHYCCCCCCLCFIVSSRINGIYHLHVCLTMQTKKRTPVQEKQKREGWERVGKKTSETKFLTKKEIVSFHSIVFTISNDINIFPYLYLLCTHFALIFVQHFDIYLWIHIMLDTCVCVRA